MSILDVSISEFKYKDFEEDVLQDVNFQIDEGSFASFIGPSGCGKTTMMKIIAGIERVSSAESKLKMASTIYNTVADTHIPKELIMVFQQADNSLLSWLSVKENIMWALKSSDIPRAKRDETITSALALTGLSRFAKNMAHELSGGNKQRLALARAVACNPKVLILDEPFNSLDFFARKELDSLVFDLWNELKLTILLVTHEIDEAIYLSQKVLVFSELPGRIIETIDIDLDKKERNYTSERFIEYRNMLLNLIS